MTKSYKKKYILFTIFHIVLNVLPLIIFVIKGFSEASLASEKMALSTTLVIVLIMTVISWLNQVTFRSKIWILLIGLYICLDSILTPLLIIAGCQILDEILISPIKNSFKEKYKIHKEIDRHG